MYEAIRPGREWLDTSGNKIQVHGGKVFYESGTFYWYGENKEKTDGKNGIWTWGIRCYSSNDLYNWEDEGLIIPPNLKSENSTLHPKQKVDRPHIIYNEKSDKYVCWIKISGKLASFIILEAEQFLGPYRIVKDNFRPFGKKVGDFDLIVDGDTKEGYLFFDADHKAIVSVKLSEDYLDVTDISIENFTGLIPPFVREAPAYLKRKNKHYLLTSGLTGYVPNPSEVAMSETIMGPYKVIGNLHPEDSSNSSYNSQISGVFKHPDKDLWIAIADRWVPHYEVTKEKYDILSRAIASRFDDNYQVSDIERSELMDSPIINIENTNTSKSDYVWLPIEWENDRPFIRWKDEWRIEDY